MSSCTVGLLLFFAYWEPSYLQHIAITARPGDWFPAIYSIIFVFSSLSVIFWIVYNPIWSKIEIYLEMKLSS